MNLSNHLKTAALAGVCVLLIGGVVLVMRSRRPEPAPTEKTIVPPPAASTLPPVQSPKLPPPVPAKGPAIAVPVAPSGRFDRTQFEQALREAAQEPDAAKRAAKLRELLASLELRDLGGAFDVVSTVFSRERTIENLRDPKNVPASCRECHPQSIPSPKRPPCPYINSYSNRQSEPMLALMTRWGQLDPLGALAKSKEFGDMGNYVVIRSDLPAELFEKMKRSPFKSFAWEAQCSALQGWAEVDPLVAANYIRQNPEVSVASDMLSKTLALWTQKDPAGAVNYFNTLTAAEQKSSVDTIGATWARQDSVAAARWATTLTDESLRATACAVVVIQMARQDPAAALAWLENLPPSASRDQATLSASVTVGREDPVAALTWAEIIQDEATRANAYKILVYQWASSDATAAAAWVDKLPAGAPRDAAATALKNAIAAKKK